MELPELLQEALEKELASAAPQKIHQASEELSRKYKSLSKDSSFMSSEAHRLAYLAARMPATYAAINYVLTELTLRKPEIAIHSLLDMGSGPGTGFWAAQSVFSSLKKATLVEQDADLIAIGKRLISDDLGSRIACSWMACAMQSREDWEAHDLVLFSYSLGELPEGLHFPLIEKLFNKAQQALVIIEPGTPAGFEKIRKIRAHLLEMGANIIAPCPNNKLPCPMSGGDWCHFPVRLQRSQEHRLAKKASLGYEDEKFSYLIVCKESGSIPNARVLRHPQKRSGHIHLTLCTGGKVATETFSKKNKEVYKQAKKLEWGSGLDI